MAASLRTTISWHHPRFPRGSSADILSSTCWAPECCSCCNRVQSSPAALIESSPRAQTSACYAFPWTGFALYLLRIEQGCNSPEPKGPELHSRPFPAWPACYLSRHPKSFFGYLKSNRASTLFRNPWQTRLNLSGGNDGSSCYGRNYDCSIVEWYMLSIYMIVHLAWDQR